MKNKAEEVNLKEEEERMKMDHHPILPLDVIMENIITRVPVRDVMRCSCVCKLWYNTICKEPHFASAYLEKSQKDASFFFFLFNVFHPNPRTPKWPVFNHFFSLGDDDEEKPYPGRSRSRSDSVEEEEEEKTPLDHFKSAHPNHFHLNHKLLMDGKEKFELVGNCNGLICVSLSSSKTKGSIWILNLSCKDHTLFITRPIIDGYTIICYGLGFDSLTHEYKIVLIARSSTITTDGDTIQGSNDNELLFKCLVFTLGENSWRETTTSNTIPLLLGGKTKTSTSFYKSAIFCGGALFWRTRSSDKQAADMLLSFDLHDDRFQVIPLPAECASSNSSMLKHKYQIVDPLLEFKGYPCVARLEKTILTGEGCCCKKKTTCTSYCYKVHLHILKDKVLQLWIKETFDVAHLRFSVPTSSAVPCFFKSTPRPPPTRIVSLSDKVFLYCFDGISMQIYNLETKCCKYASGNFAHYNIFKRKQCSPPPPNFDDDGNNNLYQKMDYHLCCRIKNFLPLQAFIPKGAPKVKYDDIEGILDDPQSKFVGFSCVTGESNDCYLF